MAAAVMLIVGLNLRHILLSETATDHDNVWPLQVATLRHITSYHGIRADVIIMRGTLSVNTSSLTPTLLHILPSGELRNISPTGR